MEQLNHWYQTLHRYPERSRKEYQTAERLTAWLTEMGLTVHRIGETAVVGVLTGDKAGKTVALRADMDALPITECTDLPYASENQGVMHACGHDFHMTAALGAAKLLSKQKNELCGIVQFVFQPDEEEDGYAAFLANHPIMKDTAAVFGAHVDPTLPKGVFGFKSGVFYASAAKFDIVFRGKSAHGATPQNGIDALAAAADTVPKLLALRETGETPAMISVGTFESGSARNIIADTATLTGILRTADPIKRNQVFLKIKAILAGAEKAFGVTVSLDFTQGYIGITNPEQTCHLAKNEAIRRFGQENVMDIPTPLMTTEDFGEYLTGRDGCFYHIGVGGEEGLHSSRFAPDPALLPNAAALHAAIILKYLEK